MKELQNFDKYLEETLTKNNVNLKDGVNYVGEGGGDAFISYAEVIEEIKEWNNAKKEKFINIADKLEKQNRNITEYLTFVANSLM